MTKTSRPFNLLIDLDGTIIGNIGPQVKEYEFIRFLNRNITNGKKERYHTTLLHDDMIAGLVRPGFAEAMYTIKKYHPSVKIYIYTASSYDWAHFVIPRLEKLLFNETFFNRPILTRNQCHPTTFQKSIAKVRPLLGNNHFTFLVDNNPTLDLKEASQLVQCPSYEYTVVVDPLRSISPKNVTNYHNIIAQFLVNFNSDNEFEMKQLLYMKLKKDYNHVKYENNKAKKDRYWSKFASVLANNDMSSVANIQKVLRKIRNIH